MVSLPGTVTLPKVYASQVMESAMRRQRTMAKVSTALVIQGDGQVSVANSGWLNGRLISSACRRHPNAPLFLSLDGLS